MATLGSDIGLAAMLTISAASFTAAIPTGVFIAGVATGDIQVTSEPTTTPLWVRGPNISLLSTVDNKNVGEWGYTIHMEMRSRGDAAHLCRYYPLVLDATVSLRAAIRPQISTRNNKPVTKAAETYFEKTLQKALGAAAPKSVRIRLAETDNIKSDAATSLKAETEFSQCEDGFLQSNTQQQPLRLNRDQSIIF